MTGSLRLLDHEESKEDNYLPIPLTSKSQKARSPVETILYDIDKKYLAGIGIRYHGLEITDGEPPTVLMTPRFELIPETDARAIAREDVMKRNPALAEDAIESAIQTLLGRYRQETIIPAAGIEYSFVVKLNDATHQPELCIRVGGHYFASGKADSVLAAGTLHFSRNEDGTASVARITDNSGAYHIADNKNIPDDMKLATQDSAMRAMRAVGLPIDGPLFVREYAVSEAPKVKS